MMQRGGAAGCAVAILLCASGCAGSAAQQQSPMSLRVVDIQSRTVQMSLHQVVRLDIGDSTASYTAEIADESVVAVVERRDETAARLEPELVPLHVGTTQVALLSSVPGHEVVGFWVVVSSDQPTSNSPSH